MMICQVPSTARQIRQMIRACIAASRSALPDARVLTGLYLHQTAVF
jgi:hypothetical protein